MGAKDMERQKLNVFRMRLLGAEVRPVHSGTATLKDATSEAIRDWVTIVETTHYIQGSAAGPHPYPMMVRMLSATKDIVSVMFCCITFTALQLDLMHTQKSLRCFLVSKILSVSSAVAVVSVLHCIMALVFCFVSSCGL